MRVLDMERRKTTLLMNNYGGESAQRVTCANSDPSGRRQSEALLVRQSQKMVLSTLHLGLRFDSATVCRRVPIIKAAATVNLQHIPPDAVTDIAVSLLFHSQPLFMF